MHKNIITQNEYKDTIHISSVRGVYAKYTLSEYGSDFTVTDPISPEWGQLTACPRADNSCSASSLVM